MSFKGLGTSRVGGDGDGDGDEGLSMYNKRPVGGSDEGRGICPKSYNAVGNIRM